MSTPSRTVSDRGSGLAAQLGRLALPLILVLMLVIFSGLSPNYFGTWRNLSNILGTNVVVVFLACAATVPLIVGRFDFSVAAVFSWSQVLFVGLVLQHHWSVPAAVLASLGSSVVLGLINGIAVVKYEVNSFVATLATGSILAGITLAYSGGNPIFGNAAKALTSLARPHFFGLELPVFYALLVAVVLTVVLGHLPVGRRMYATGGNERAAYLTGISTRRYIYGTFLTSSLLASAGGIILGSSLGSATSDAGSSLLITSFAAAFLGATAFHPGRFNIPGTVVAVYVVGVAVAGLAQLGASLWVPPVFEGAVLLIAVGLTAWTNRLRAQRAQSARLRELEAGRVLLDNEVEHSTSASVQRESGHTEPELQKTSVRAHSGTARRYH